jgi:hypothetical protein
MSQGFEPSILQILAERFRNHSQAGLKYPQQYRLFRTATKIVALTVAVLVAISTVAAGMYYSPARPSSPLCANAATIYPLCDNCGSSGASVRKPGHVTA